MQAVEFSFQEYPQTSSLFMSEPARSPFAAFLEVNRRGPIHERVMNSAITRLHQH